MRDSYPSLRPLRIFRHEFELYSCAECLLDQRKSCHHPVSVLIIGIIAFPVRSSAVVKRYRLQHMNDAEYVLDRLRVGAGYPNVYWIGRKATRLTFLSQQQRAVNLIWALVESKCLRKGSKVTVVGAGLAGLTAAAAAASLEANVTLLESKLEPLHLQRGTYHRFVHPNYLEWPTEGFEKSITDLPLLNWYADMAGAVCDTVLEQWDAIGSSVITHYGLQVQSISCESGSQRPAVFTEGGDRNLRIDSDILILAVGFGIERSLTGITPLSYWDNDNLSRAFLSGKSPRVYLVTGCGDGGLTDAIRLSIRAFKHDEFTYRLSRLENLETFKKDLSELDSKVAAELDAKALQDKSLRAARESSLLEDSYRRLEIPAAFQALVTQDLRNDTVVYLNGPTLSPFSLGSSVLNRIIVYLLREKGKLRYRQGRLDADAVEGKGPFRIRFSNTEFFSEDLEIDQIVVRHGPEPAIRKLLPKNFVADGKPTPS